MASMTGMWSVARAGRHCLRGSRMSATSISCNNKNNITNIAASRNLICIRSFFTSETTSGSSNEAYLTGTVKFYLRNKAYGFIKVDSPELANGATEVFVHRTSFDTEHSIEDGFINRPYLNEKERVRFRLEATDDANKTMRAKDMTFENGKRIPLYRKNYAMAVVRSELEQLGTSVLQIMDNNESGQLTDAEILQEIRDRIQNAKSQMEKAQIIQEKYGETSASSTPPSEDT